MRQPGVPARASRTPDTDEMEEVDDRIAPLSAIRRDRYGNQVIQQGNRRIVIHEEPPPKKSHWLLFIGIGMLAMVAFWFLIQLAGHGGRMNSYTPPTAIRASIRPMQSSGMAI